MGKNCAAHRPAQNTLEQLQLGHTHCFFWADNAHGSHGCLETSVSRWKMHINVYGTLMLLNTS